VASGEGAVHPYLTDGEKRTATRPFTRASGLYSDELKQAAVASYLTIHRIFFLRWHWRPHERGFGQNGDTAQEMTVFWPVEKFGPVCPCLANLWLDRRNGINGGFEGLRRPSTGCAGWSSPAI
jgi:hypothetical protein